VDKEDTERRVREYLDALLSGGDFAAFFSDDIVWTTMETGDEIHGRYAVRDFIVALHSQLFDASPEFKGITVSDGTAGLEAVFVGTHVAEFGGVAPTGTKVRLPYSVFYDFVDGKITALRAYFPVMALIAQLRDGAG
jgi:predicted ester cyclase